MLNNMIGISWLKGLLKHLALQPEKEVRQKEQLWSIGIYVGKSPFALEAANNAKNPVLTREDVSDVRALFIADPFMLKVQGIWYMFFEIYNRDTGKGEIGFAISMDGFNWRYQQIVLSEPFHLSYPYVFQWMGEYYMIPETYSLAEVRLYKARRFPSDWMCVETLLRGQKFSDSSIFHHHNTWWLFTAPNPDLKQDTLSLYYSTDLGGPWREHSQSPVIQGDPHIARPGGRVLVLHDRIIRYTQDCFPTYGTAVRAFEITQLTTSMYKEQQSVQNTLLGPSGVGWNEGGMHHIDPHLMEDGQWLACVDGWVGVEKLMV